MDGVERSDRYCCDFGTAGGRFFRLDPKTKHVTVLRGKEAGLLAMDRQGSLYFRDHINLWKYTPAASP